LAPFTFFCEKKSKTKKTACRSGYAALIDAFLKKALQKIPRLRFIPCEILEKWSQSKILPLFLCLYRRFERRFCLIDGL